LERMQPAALHHTEMARELAVLQAAVTFAMESVLGHSPDETFQVEVVSELVVELQRLEELCSHLELPM
jgi:hypothetical protein